MNLPILLSGFFVLSAVLDASAQSYRWTTLGGSFPFGSTDGEGTDARFRSPGSPAIDRSGTVYVVDSDNHTVRQLIRRTTAAGISWSVTTLAGQPGVAGSQDGPAATARFQLPSALALDGAGNLYVADAGNNRIRGLLATENSWRVTTLQGTNGPLAPEAPTALAWDRGSGLYVLDRWGEVYHLSPEGTIWRSTPVSQDQRPDSLLSLAVDATGTLYAAGQSQQIGMLRPGQSTWTTIPFSPRLTRPIITVNRPGRLYLAGATAIWRLSNAGETWSQSLIAGVEPTSTGAANALAGDAPFLGLSGLAEDTSGNLVATDYGSASFSVYGIGGTAVVHQLTPADGTWTVSTLAGGTTPALDLSRTVSAAVATFSTPMDIARDSRGNLFVLDAGNAAVRQLTPTNTAEGAGWTVATIGRLRAGGTSGGGAVAVGPDDTVFVADSADHTIRAFARTPDGWQSRLVAGEPGVRADQAGRNWNGTNSTAHFLQPTAIVCDPAGILYVKDGTGIRRVAPRATATGTQWIVTSAANGYFGTRMALDKAGNLLTVDGATGSLVELALKGTTWTPIRVAPGIVEKAIGGGHGVAVDRAGLVYVTDPRRSSVLRLTPAGTNWQATTIAGPTVETINGYAARILDEPLGVTVTDDGVVYFADSRNNLIRSLTPAGTSYRLDAVAGRRPGGTAVDGPGPEAVFAKPLSLARDPQGNLYLSDATAIRQFSPKVTASGTNWVATTIAGYAAFTGLVDGPGSSSMISLPGGTNRAQAMLYAPHGIALDRQGALYVADHHTVRRLVRSDTGWTLTTLAGGYGNSQHADGANRAAGFDDLRGLTVDADGTVFLSEVITTFSPGGALWTSNCVRRLRLTGSDWVATTELLWRSDGSQMSGVLAGNTGSLFLRSGAAIEELTRDGDSWRRTLIAGHPTITGLVDGVGPDARFGAADASYSNPAVGPNCLALDASGNLYVADGANHAVRRLTRRVTPQGTVWNVETVGGTPEAGSTPRGYADGFSGLFEAPRAVVSDPVGNLTVIDASIESTIAGRGLLRQGMPLPDVRLHMPTSEFHDTEIVRWNAVGLDAASTSVRLVALRDGVTYPIGTAPSLLANGLAWDTRGVPDGRYRLRASFLDGDGVERAVAVSDPLAVINAATWHGGTLVSGESWGAGLHVIASNVIVPAGVELRLEPGAILKFTPRTGLVVREGGLVTAGTPGAPPVILTALGDDTVGGDTNHDGVDSEATTGAWSGVDLDGGQLEAPGSLEIRFAFAQVGGTLAGDATWGRLPYVVATDLTVPGGVTLTIRAGATVKFAPGTSLHVSAGGVLDARGSVAQPILFTSLLDDAVAGDTNGDGDWTSPQAGDWDSVYVQGRARFDHVKLRYGAGASLLVSGLISSTDSASVTVTHCELSDGFYHGIQAGGLVTVENSIIRDCDRGLKAAGEARVIHCTLHRNRIGLIAHCGTLIVSNSIVAESFETGVQSDCGGIPSPGFNNVWSTATQGYANYRGVPDPTGTAGNFSADPRFAHPDQADFRLRFLSPCIDAADARLASPADLAGAPRYTDPRTQTKPGVPGPDGVFADVGALEFVENADSDVDLQVAEVTPPAAIRAGERAHVEWTVVNRGTGYATGPWHDSIALASPSADAEPIAVGEWLVGEDLVLGPGQTQVMGADVLVPGATEGNYQWQIQVNRRGEVFEGTRWTNNVTDSSARSGLTLPVLAVGAPAVTGHFRAAGDSAAYRLSADGADALLSLRATSGAGALELYVGDGYCPTPSRFDRRSEQFNSASVSLLLTDADRGTCYVTAYARSLGASSVPFALEASLPAFAVKSVSPNRIANRGPATIQVDGFLLDASARYQLFGVGGSLAATAVRAGDGTVAYATFDLAGAPTGIYGLSVTRADGRQASLPLAVQVESPTTTSVSFQLQVPRLYRVGQVFAGSVSYFNPGNNDLPAPLLVVGVGGQAALRLQPQDPFTTDDLILIAASLQGPAGVLRPGQRWTLPFSVLASSPVRLPFHADYKPADATDLVDYDGLAARLKPEGFAEAEWVRSWARLRTLAGPTWGGFVARLAEYSTRLQQTGRLGQPGGTFYSAQDVLAFALADCLAQEEPAVAGTLRLLDTRQPLAGASVLLASEALGAYLVAETAADGSFRLLHVPPGPYDVSVPGYWLEPPRTVTVPPSGILADLDLAVTRGGAIRGVVRSADGNSYLPAVAVRVDSADGTPFPARTGGDGSFAVEGLRPGTYRVSAGGDSYETKHLDGILVEADAVRAVEFRLASGASVTGRVLANGQPVSGALVGVGSASGPEGSTLSDPDGVFTIRGLSAGTYSVRVLSAVLAPFEVTAEVLPGYQVDLGTLSAPAAATLSARLLSPSQAPVPGAALSVHLGEALVARRLVDAQGIADFIGLAAGEYTLVSSAYGFRNATGTVALAASATAAHTLIATPLAGVSGTVTDAAGAPIPDLPVSAIGIESANEGFATSVLTDPLGYYELRGFEAGSYVVTVGNLGGIDARTVTIPPNLTSRTLDFQLPGFRLEGRVVLADGRTAVPDAAVWLGQDGEMLATARTDEQGGYVFRVMTAGTYSLRATSRELGLSASAAITLGSAANVGAPLLVLGERQLTGRVTNAAGSPLDGTTVRLVALEGTRILWTASTTARNGEYGFAGLVPGLYQVLVRSAGYGTLLRALDLRSDTNLDLVLDPGLVQAGKIFSATTGAGIPDATVSLLDTSTRLPIAVAVTGDSGAFLVGDLRAADYGVLVEAAGYQVAWQQAMPAAPAGSSWDLALAPAATAAGGRVTDAQGDPIRLATLTFHDAASREELTATRTDSDGSWSIGELPPGTYELRITATGYHPVRRSPVAIASGPVDLGSVSLREAATDDQRDTYIQIVPTEGTAFLAEKIADLLFKFTGIQEPNCTDVPSPPFPTRCWDGSYAGSAEYAAAVNAEQAANHACRHWKEQYAAYSQISGSSSGIAGISGLKALASVYASIYSAQYQGALEQFGMGLDKAEMWAEAGGQGLATGADLAKIWRTGAPLLKKLQGLSPSRPDYIKQVLRETGAATADFLSQGIAIPKAIDALSRARGGTGVFNFGIPRAAGPILSVFKAVIDLWKAYDDYKSSVGPLERARMDYQDWMAAYATAVNRYAAAARCPPKPPKPEDPNRADDDDSDPGTTSDPNDKLTTGVGPQGYVARGTTLTYTIDFENQPSATLPVQVLVVTDALDPRLDWSTLELGTLGFNGITVPVPPNRQTFTTTVRVATDDSPVEVNAALDPATGLLTWRLQSIDPVTSLPVADPLAGFLPPDNPRGEGRGYLTYRIASRSDLADGTRITNAAVIVFDQNDPIPTPTVTNTIDGSPPVSSVQPLPAVSSTTNFVVSWSGLDGASGIAAYDVFVSTGADWRPWQRHTTNTSASFAGTLGTTYSFLSTAVDRVGNAQATRTQPDTRIRLATSSTPTLAGRIDYTLSFLPSVGGLVLFGGWGPPDWAPQSDAWKLDTTGWQPVPVSGAPPLAHHGMTYDPVRQALWLCGPCNASAKTHPIWRFDGQRWLLSTNLPTGASGDAEIAFDTDRRRLVLYWAESRFTGSGLATWESDGTNWVRQTIVPPPVSCADGALFKYHPGIRRTVLVGQDNASRTIQTWLWDGSLWMPVGGIQPAGPIAGGMAFHAARNEMVLLATDLNTWTFDGAGWTPRQPAHRPALYSNSYFALEYDPLREVSVCYGGEARVTAQDRLSYPETTWEWTGTDWRVFVPEAPGVRLEVARLASGQLVLSWPASATGYRLEVSPEIAPAAWQVVPGEPGVVGDRRTVTNQPSADHAFFRLAR